MCHQILDSKWANILPSPTSFRSELLRWKITCENYPSLKEASICHLLETVARKTFFPNVRELLCILAVLPMGSCEAERTFSCVRRLDTWLRSSMTVDRLSNLAVIAMHSIQFPLSTENVTRRFMSMHPRRLLNDSLLWCRGSSGELGHFLHFDLSHSNQLW